MEIKHVIKQGEGYFCDIDVSVEEWKMLLQNEKIMSPNRKDALIKFYNEPEHKSTCKALANKHGKTFNYFNTNIWTFGRVVQKKLNRFEMAIRTSTPNFWIIPMMGKYIKSGFEWTLRPELVQAMEELNFIENYLPTYEDIIEEEEQKLKKIQKLSKEKIEEKIKQSNPIPEKATVTLIRYNRNEYVVKFVLDRANGFCETCKNSAPFLRAKDNTPYLEVHHIIPLAENGEDTIENTIALCPNCHREAHFGK
jgi:predicted HNH restriction endonuclease